jgi:hypothetical protein
MFSAHLRVSEQTVVAQPPQTRKKHVDQEAADELVARDGHRIARALAIFP